MLPEAAPRSQFFTIRTDPKPVNNFLIFFFQALKREKTRGKKKNSRANNQSDCRIRYRARLEKNKFIYFWLNRVSFSLPGDCTIFPAVLELARNLDIPP